MIEDYTGLVNKASKLASADFEVNGDYRNAPYSVLHEGEVFKVRIKGGHGPDDPMGFVIIRPESYIGSFRPRTESEKA